MGPEGTVCGEVSSISIKGFGWLRCKLPSKLTERCTEALCISLHVKSTLKKTPLNKYRSLVNDNDNEEFSGKYTDVSICL